MDVKRVFPFDSGAYSRKIYPDYIKHIDIDHFSVSGVRDAPSRIIGAFFGDIKNYLEMKPKSESEFVAEFSVGPLDAEIKSLHRLASERSAVSFDDRRFTIEVQSGEDVNLNVNKPLAVIAPSEYFEDKSVLDCVVKRWGAEPISYKIFSLSVSAIYGEIYSKVHKLYCDNGII